MTHVTITATIFDKMIKIWVIKISFTLLAVSGCSNHSYVAPIEDAARPPSTRLLSHTVAKGDTLYAIAWRYDTTVQTLADINKLADKSKIYIGQTLYLKAAAVPRSRRVDEPTSRQPKGGHRTPTAVTKPTTSKATQSPVAKPQERSKKTTLIRNPQKVPVKKDSDLRWSWPHSGAIARGSSSSSALNKGVDIVGKLGDSVLAASSGIVVYSGEGLRGYGKLLIIKHNQNFLSAYAHNDKLLVKEGDKVERKQPIALMGSSGTNKVKLHFEIRRDGKPVNPTQYLPTR